MQVVSGLEKEVLEFVASNGAVLISDVARHLKIKHQTASDLTKRLEDAGLVSIVNKGVAKLIIAKKQTEGLITNETK